MTAEPGAAGSTGERAFLYSSGALAGLVLGAASGAAEIALLGARRTFTGQLVFVAEHFWWLAPWVNAIIVSLLSIVTVTLLSRRRSHRRAALSFGVPLGLAAAATLLLVPGLHRFAVLVLALGIGVRGGMLLARRANLVDRLCRWGVPALLVVLPLLSTALFRLPAHATAASRAAATAAGLPNIILIVLDTVRAVELSLYGAPASTSPVIARLGAEGVVFERASSSAPWTLPAHGSLFTGRWAFELSTSLLTPLDERDETIAERLATMGYRTAGFSANVEYASAETGVARGFSHYEDHRWSLLGVLMLTQLSRSLTTVAIEVLDLELDLPGRIDAQLVNQRFLRWLEPGADAPFFAFLNYYDAHAPYYPPDPQWRRFVGDTRRRPLNNSHNDAGYPDRVNMQRRAYAGAINYIDMRIGELVDSLERRGLLENTLIVITADHGEEFAEHGVLGHGNTLYLPSVHVPLLLRLPQRIPPGGRVPHPVSTRDVPATILDIIGSPQPFPGYSLVELWSDAVTPARGVYTYTQRAINQPASLPASRGPLIAFGDWPYRLIAETDPAHVALYDRSTDPEEQHDISDRPELRGVMGALLDSLFDSGFDLHQETSGYAEPAGMSRDRDSGPPGAARSPPEGP